MLRVPPPNVFQSLINRPFANRPFVLHLDYIYESGCSNHIFQLRGYVDRLPKLFAGFDGKHGTVMEEVVRADRTVVGRKNRGYLGVFQVASRGDVAART